MKMILNKISQIPLNITHIHLLLIMLTQSICGSRYCLDDIRAGVGDFA